MKIIFTLFLLLVLVLSLSLNVDASAMKLQDEALERSFAAFALAKALNAVISLFQGTVISFTPIGIGVNFSVGEVLDPFNDMVERFSWVMLFATVSLGIQKLLLILSAKIFLQVSLALSILVLLVLLWIKRFQNELILSYAFRALLFLLLLRFSAVAFVYASQLLYTSTLQAEYESASKVIQVTQQKLETLKNENEILIKSHKDKGFFDGVSSKYNKIVENLNLSKRLSELEESIEKASTKMVTLITIFVVQSVCLPLLYLWLLLQILKFIFKINLNTKKLKLLYNAQ